MKQIDKADKEAKKGDGYAKALKSREQDIDTAFSLFSSACVEQAGKSNSSFDNFVCGLDFAMAYFKRG